MATVRHGKKYVLYEDIEHVDAVIASSNRLVLQTAFTYANQRLLYRP